MISSTGPSCVNAVADDEAARNQCSAEKAPGDDQECFLWAPSRIAKRETTKKWLPGRLDPDDNENDGHNRRKDHF
jgi:hypothetical protein